ncbi:WAP four-disulfide core domain protein 12-like [Crotalus tigris]|uniref:WAP four-disulfide core domain protein 12-like n=1 Tax=Crotalus tigris TaxID=88082 RepID=UPI00192F2D62|nr:WAP four-disulfide core domain protein 12-like [Crotalus tigris]
MKLLTTFLLVALLALWVGFPSTTGSDIPTVIPQHFPPVSPLLSPEGKVQQNPGVCPRDHCRCTGPQPDECKRDCSCKEKKKCCFSCCAMHCVDPE